MSLLRRLLGIHSPSAHASGQSCPGCDRETNDARALAHAQLWERPRVTRYACCHHCDHPTFGVYGHPQGCSELYCSTGHRRYPERTEGKGTP